MLALAQAQKAGQQMGLNSALAGQSQAQNALANIISSRLSGETQISRENLTAAEKNRQLLADMIGGAGSMAAKGATKGK
jgi:hypothetical protein